MEDLRYVLTAAIQLNYQIKWLTYGTARRMNFCFRLNPAEGYFSMLLYVLGSPSGKDDGGPTFLRPIFQIFCPL